MVLEPSDVVKDGKYRRHNLVKHRVAHLAGHLAGGPLTTLVVSKVGNVRRTAGSGRRPSPDRRLDRRPQEGQRCPLPLPVKTAFAHLADVDGNKEHRAPGLRRWLQRPGRSADQPLPAAGVAGLRQPHRQRRVWLAEHLLRPLYMATFSAKSAAKVAEKGDAR